jgi:hypothetical protein
MKNTKKKLKRQLMKCEKIFANPVSDMRLVSRMYKEYIKKNMKIKMKCCLVYN